MIAAPYYRHSGSVPVAGVVLALGAGLPLAALAGLVYALVLFIPIVGTVSFIFTAGFGGVAGMIGGLLAKKIKLRNTPVALALTVALTAAAYWASWAVWLGIKIDDVTTRQLIASPGLLWQCVNLVNGVGAWSLKGLTPTGTFLWILWGIELAIVFGVALLVGSSLVDDPFCERCERWTDEEKDLAILAAGDREALRRSLEAQDFGALEKCGLPSDAARFQRLSLHHCSQCNDFTTLNVTDVTLTRDKDGKVSSADTTYVRNLILDRDQTRTVRELKAKLTAAAVPADVSGPIAAAAGTLL